MPPSYPPQQPPPDGGGLYPPPSIPPNPPIQPTPPQAPIPDSSLLPWRNEIDRRLAELEGRQPIPGPAGKDGKVGPPGPPGENGLSPDPATIAQLSAQFITIDIDAIAAKVREQQLPLFIGAKDADGKITMPPAAVYPGDTVFIRVTLPSLNNARNN